MAKEQVEAQAPSEDDLFEGAVADQPETETVTETVDTQAEPEGQPRDEAGRFAGKPEDKPDETLAATDPPAKVLVDDNAAMVPSWRVREINEEKRAQAAELERLRAERAQWQRQQQPREELKPAEKASKPDPLLDPDGYAKAVREEVRNELLSERREDSMARARESNPKEFDEAFAAATQNGVDPGLKGRMQAARDPGRVLLDWHREQKTRQEIGGDLSAYNKRILDEALKNPEFRKTAIAAWQADASSQQPNGRPRVDLPPSLNGASRSNAALRSAMTADVDDDALFEQTTG